MHHLQSTLVHSIVEEEMFLVVCIDVPIAKACQPRWPVHWAPVALSIAVDNKE